MKNSNTFWCDTCKGIEIGSSPELVKHLADVHTIDAKATKGKRTMLMHTDSRTWFSSSYKWNIGGIELHQEITCRRARDDMMRFA